MRTRRCETFNLAWVHVALWGSGGSWVEGKLLPRRTTEAKSSGPPERRRRSERLLHSRTAKPHPPSFINPVPVLRAISLPWNVQITTIKTSNYILKMLIFKQPTFIFTRSRSWIQQLAMEAPVLRSKSEGAEPRLTPTSIFAQSEVSGMSRPTTQSWPESFLPSSYGNDPRRRRPGSLWSKFVNLSEPWRPKCVIEEFRLLRGLSSQFSGCRAVGADPLLNVNRDVS